MEKQNKNQINPSLTCAIIDAARIFGELDTAQKLQSNFLSLFMGQSEELLSSVAPYLFPFQINTEFGKWLLDKGWGNSWGMFITTNLPLEDLRKHFRKFLMVKTEEGKELYFRFYDPRVLRIFLPTCDEQQLTEFFGPVNNYAMEDEDPEYAILFAISNKKLVVERMLKGDFWKNLNNGQEFTLVESNYIMPSENISPPEQEKTKENPAQPQKPNTGWSFLID